MGSPPDPYPAPTSMWSIYKECGFLALECVYKRLVFYLWPEERQRDLDRVTEGYKVDEWKIRFNIFWVYGPIGHVVIIRFSLTMLARRSTSRGATRTPSKTSSTPGRWSAIISTRKGFSQKLVG